MTPPESSIPPRPRTESSAAHLAPAAHLARAATAQWLAGLWLLPLAAIVALSGGLEDPQVLPVGTVGAWALAIGLVPALLSLRAGGRSVPGTLMLAAVGLLGTAGWSLTGGADPFGASLAGVQFGVLWMSVALGASLDARGRAQFASWLPWFGVALGALLLWAPAQLEGGSPLGNVGRDSQALIPAAAAGAAWYVHGAKQPWIGLAVILALGVHAATRPVLAGGLVLLVVGSLLLLRPSASSSETAEESGTQKLRRAVPAIVGLVALAWPLLQQSAPAAPMAETQEVARFQRDDLGGLEVRARLWSTLPALIAANPMGVGHGQFAAQYPPFRDAEERERSSFGGAQPTEVEHLHHDLFAGLAEYGLLGGALLAWFLLLSALRCFAALGGSPADRALGAAGLATLITGLQHTVLLGNPLAALMGGGAIGACWARAHALRQSEATSPKARAPLQALLLPLAAGVMLQLPAFEVQRHAAQLSAIAANNSDFLAAQPADVPALIDARERAFAELLADGPASVLGVQLIVPEFDGALAPELAPRWASLTELPERATDAVSLVARLIAERGELRAVQDTEGLAGPRGAAVWEQRELVELWKRYRPHSAQGWVQQGFVEAREGRLAYAAAPEVGVERLEEAREAWNHAASLEPESSVAARNALLLELECGSLERVVETLEDDPTRLGNLTQQAYLLGWRGLHDTLRLLEEAGNFPEYGESAKAIADRLEAQGSSPRARAFWNALAHHMWAHDHLEAGNLDDARRSLRQAVRQVTTGGDQGSPILQAELDAVRRATGDGGRTDAATLDAEFLASLERLGAHPSLELPRTYTEAPGKPRPELVVRFKQCHPIVATEAAELIANN
jgi:tetratricopeptide (TPR) repeat protein